MQTFVHTLMHTSAPKCTLAHPSMLNFVYKHNPRLEVAYLQQIYFVFPTIYTKLTISPQNFTYKTYFMYTHMHNHMRTSVHVMQTVCINQNHAALTL